MAFLNQIVVIVGMTFISAFTLAAARTELRLGLESTSYFSQVTNSAGRSSFSLLQADFRSFNHNAKYVGWGVNAGVGYITDTKEPLLRANEAYLASTDSLSQNYQLSVGRRIYLWSQMDQDWRLGLWQPRFLWDYLNPEIQGLTGVFATVLQSGWELLIWASPVFIPEQGAPLRNDRGRIVSSSRWISEPANRVSFLDQDSPLNYYINVPPNSEVVSNPGAAASMRIGDRSDGYWTQFGYGYKPMNQLLLSARPDILVQGREIGEDPNKPNSATANVRIYPRVVYHQVSEMAAGYSVTEKYSVWISALSEQPIMDRRPDNEISQQVGPMFLLSPGMSYDFPAIGPHPTRVKATILRQWGGDAEDAGELATPDRSRFQPRYPFRNAAQLEYQMPLWWSGVRVLTIVTRGVYEWADQGVVFSPRLNYRPNRVLSVTLGADFLGQWGGENDSIMSFGARYRGNDRIYGGIQYVF